MEHLLRDLVTSVLERIKAMHTLPLRAYMLFMHLAHKNGLQVSEADPTCRSRVAVLTIRYNAANAHQ